MATFFCFLLFPAFCVTVLRLFIVLHASLFFGKRQSCIYLVLFFIFLLFLCHSSLYNAVNIFNAQMQFCAHLQVVQLCYFVTFYISFFIYFLLRNSFNFYSFYACFLFCLEFQLVVTTFRFSTTTHWQHCHFTLPKIFIFNVSLCELGACCI